MFKPLQVYRCRICIYKIANWLQLSMTTISRRICWCFIQFDIYDIPCSITNRTFHYARLNQVPVSLWQISLLQLWPWSQWRTTQTKHIYTDAQPTHFLCVSHVFFLLLLSFQAFSPPELRVIGSDISTPASHSTDTGEHKEAWCTKPHTNTHLYAQDWRVSSHCTTIHKTNTENRKKKKGFKRLLWLLSMTPGISDLKIKILHFIFISKCQGGWASKSPTETCTVRKAKSWIFNTELKRLSSVRFNFSVWKHVSDLRQSEETWIQYPSTSWCLNTYLLSTS